MSGISGIVNVRGIKTLSIKSMTDIIRHRGPDDEGFVLFENNGQFYCCAGQETPKIVWESKLLYSPVISIDRIPDNTFNLALGHRLLSIKDFSALNHQPMSYNNNRYWICYSGKIYNAPEIKNELIVLGHQIKSGADSELILAAYSEWGPSFLNKLNGVWAFCIYDHYLKEIFLTRDRFGVKPLYYWFSPEGDFCFASEIKQFTTLPGWKAKVNYARAYDYLTYSFTDHTDETLFDGVFQLHSGSFFKAPINNIIPTTSGRLNSVKWYQFKSDPFKGTFNEACHVFNTLLKDSVFTQMPDKIAFGTFLSGGLDSSSIVCIIDDLLKNNKGLKNLPKTFSAYSDNNCFSEKEWIDIVIKHTSTTNLFIKPDVNDVIKFSSKVIWHQDEPYQSQSALLGYLLYKLAKANEINVILNGQGADEYLGGYGQFTMARFANYVRHFKFLTLLNEIKNLRKIRSVSNLSLTKEIAFHLLPDPIVRIASNFRSSSDSVKKVINYSKINKKISHPFDVIPVKYHSIPEIVVHLTFYSTLPKYLRWEDRNSMAHSIEARTPFMDHRLVEFSFSLPDHFLEKDGINKRILREAMRQTLPEAIKNRKDKMGFITPEEQWVKQDNPIWFRNKILNAVEITGGIVKPDAVKYFDDMVKGDVAFDYLYWRLILFSEWIEKFNLEI